MGLNPFWTIVVTQNGDAEAKPIIVSGRQRSPRDLFEHMRYKRELPGVDMGLGEESSRVDLYENYKVLAAFKGLPELVASPTENYHQSGLLDEEWSEQDECERMTNELRLLGINADSTNTGGNCWASIVKLNDTDTLYVTTWPAWAWSIDREGEQLLAGDWGVEDVPRAAKRVKKLIKGLGSIVS
ncbi:hypothetical protein AB0A69_08170 [Streptomyces sp. NPDC045431]|uniref:hypothetical protein n=1 Tax=Streptomyces sp. NPDC045431 TaxID=3155613 RepID=UPI0033DEFEB6